MERFVALDALRGICALAVVVHHYPPNWIVPGTSMWQNGWVFVDFFFVLSGFVMVHVYGDRLDTGRAVWGYLWRRFWRVYPLHMAAQVPWIVVAFIGASHFSGFREASFEPLAFLWHALLVNGFVSAETWNSPAWSISTEFGAYVVFALVSVLPIPRRGFAVLVIGVVAGAWLAGLVENMTIWRTLIGFFLGVLAYDVFRRLPELSPNVSTLVEIVFVVGVGAGAAWLARTPYEVVLPFVFLGAVVVFARARGLLGRLLSGRVGEWLGRLSFSIYLLHFWVLLMGLSLADAWDIIDANMVDGTYFIRAGPLEAAGVLVVCLAVIGVASVFTERFVERPFYQWARRYFEIPR